MKAYTQGPIIARLLAVLTLTGDPRVKEDCCETYLGELYRFPITERPVIVVRRGKDGQA